MTRNSAPIFITCGEPAGVGVEIVLKAKLRRADLPPVVLHEAPERVAAIAADHDWPIKVVIIDIAWGMVLCGSVATAGYFIAQFLKV